MRQRFQVLKEIVCTEQQYTHHLYNCIKVSRLSRAPCCHSVISAASSIISRSAPSQLSIVDLFHLQVGRACLLTRCTRRCFCIRWSRRRRRSAGSGCKPATLRQCSGLWRSFTRLTSRCWRSWSNGIRCGQRLRSSERYFCSLYVLWSNHAASSYL